MIWQLRLYTREGCCLCDEMKSVVRQVAAEIPVSVEELDVDRDPLLKERYGHEVPVLLINGRKAFKYRTTAKELKIRLRKNL